MTAPCPAHVVITGASSGLGAALAKVYSTPGAHLTLLARDRTRLATVAEQCRSLGASVKTASIDVVDFAALSRALREADRVHPIDLLIANAGIGGAHVLAGPDGEPPALAHEIIAVNTLGVIYTVAPLLPAFAARGKGQIVIIGSLAYEGLAESPAYSASKAAVRSYGHGLRRLLREKGVQVTVVSAGFMTTPMSASLPFKPLFAMSAEKAAAIIRPKVAKGATEITFPWQFTILLRLTSVMPLAITDFILRMGHKLVAHPPHQRQGK